MSLLSEKSSPKKILIADANKTNLLLLSQILESFFDIDFAYSEDEAVENLINDKEYSLVLCSPKILPNGVAKFLECIIDKCPSYLKTPIVYFSENYDAKLEEECYHCGGASFVVLESSLLAISRNVSQIIELYGYRETISQTLIEQTKHLELIRQQIIQAFSAIIEGRDSSTGMHIKRTAAYVDIVVRGLRERNYYIEELTDEKWDAIIRGAPLHDLGKISISDTILCKPGRLTTDEFDIMKTHAEVGGKMIRETLSDIESNLVLSTAYDMAMYHHERWDGSGYPYGRAKTDIPLSARIMAIADVFDALVSKRCYKDAFTYDESFEIIRQSSGSHFDPKIVDVFLELKDEVIAVSESWAL